MSLLWIPASIGVAVHTRHRTDYYGAIIQFRIEGSGVLGLLWARDSGTWKIVSYQPLKQ
jgi:hypothetical protein